MIPSTRTKKIVCPVLFFNHKRRNCFTITRHDHDFSCQGSICVSIIGQSTGEDYKRLLSKVSVSSNNPRKPSSVSAFPPTCAHWIGYNTDTTTT